MGVSVLVAGLLLAQEAIPTVTVEAAVDRVDVGYAELVDGRPAAAIERIRANDALASDDPAALINLGAAHARMGQARAAEGFYRAAVASAERYHVQLADGRWMDSRRAARLAVERLAQGEVLALR